MSLDQIMEIFKLATGHQWLPLAILVVGYLVNLTSDTGKFPLNIPDRFKPLIALVLGQVYAVLEAVYGGSPWGTAVGHGLIATLAATGFAHILLNAVFNGTLPKWLAWLNFVDPTLVQAKKMGRLVAPLWGKKSVVAANDVVPPKAA
jgi:hypothetical protein